jgi:hypothetical protein
MTQANMTDVKYSRASDGSMNWSAATVNHSAATTAGGTAFAKGTLAVGTAVATSGVPTLLK